MKLNNCLSWNPMCTRRKGAPNLAISRRLCPVGNTNATPPKTFLALEGPHSFAGSGAVRDVLAGALRSFLCAELAHLPDQHAGSPADRDPAGLVCGASGPSSARVAANHC